MYVTEFFLQNRYPCNGKIEHASNVCIEKVPESILRERIAKIERYSKGCQLNIATVAAVNVRYKGQEYVIRAIAKLNNELGFNYHYYMVGGGDNSFLKSVVTLCDVDKYVHFMGPLPHDKVTEILDKMDIYIQPSKQEGLPRALIEAMSRGLPSIGTRVAGIPELLNDEFLVKKGSVTEIVHALATQMTPDSMITQSQQNFIKASKYTLDIINARRQHFFDEFIRENFRIIKSNTRESFTKGTNFIMKKKKIAFIVAIPGSAHSFLIDHFRKLVDLYNVHLIADFSSEKDKEEFEELGIICHSVPIKRSINIFQDIKALSMLRRVFAEEKFASVHSVTPKAGLLSAVASWAAGIKVRIHIYTGQVWATKKGFVRILLKQMDKMIALFDNHLLVDGESQRQFLIREGVLKSSNSRVLANGSICGVHLERFNISDKIRCDERAKFGFSNENVVYIFLGRLNHDKGIGELYSAFNKLVIECPEAKLILYGDDEEGYEAKAVNFKNMRRNDNFFYPGATHNPYDALQVGDVFVLPTWREGFGSSVIEAQALALPVITSDAYGVLDASVENETGLRCHVGDADSLYKCMKVYYENPTMRRMHGIAGRKRIEEKFDNNLVTAAWIKYYKELV